MKAVLILWMMAGASATGWKPIPAPPGTYNLHFLDGTSPIGNAFPNFDQHPEPKPEVISEEDQNLFSKAVEDSGYQFDSVKSFKPLRRPFTSFNAHPVKFRDRKFGKPDFVFQKGFGENEIGPYHPFNGYDEQCPLYKVSLRQDLSFQYIQYKAHMPDLKEFTICMWSKFHNHSYDHPLFSYAARHQPKAIYMWVSNVEGSNFYNMKINGHPIFRLNYPIRLSKWYHTCQSWNAKTGEWQVWVNGHRIARGFHNLLVGHIIPGGGTAITGQEQLQYGGGFLKNLKGYRGFMGEITMVQFYRIALSAGKAYTDHRHHHSHFASTTPEPPEFPSEEPPPTPEHPFLENGQLKRPLKVHELAESIRMKDSAQSRPSFGDFFQNYGYPLFGDLSIQEHSIFKRNEASDARGRSLQEAVPILSDSGTSFPLNETAEFETVDEGKTEPEARVGRAYRRPIRESFRGQVRFPGRKGEKMLREKQFILGDVQFRPEFYPGGVLSQGTQQKEEEEEEEEKLELEPAEDEVRHILKVCSGCQPDPYRKVAVISWRSTPKKLYSGALFIKARSECRKF